MATEPWAGYPPELNAGRIETGVGEPTWVASAGMWTTFASLVGEAMAAWAAEVAAIAANWQGSAPIQLTAVTAPFMAWLMEMEAVAAANALACYGVSEAFAIVNGSLIPTPAVNANRISEMIAEATNFFNINSGLILFLNQQYGQYWTQNAGAMLSYDEAVQIATLPKPSTPPPPLSDSAQALQAAADAGQLATSSVTDPMLSALQQGGQGSSSAAQAPTELIQSMAGSAPQLLQAPMQALQGGGGSNPLSNLMSPFESLLTSFGGNTDSPEALTGGGPWSSTFAPPGGALADVTGGGASSSMSTGGGSGALGGGLGGSMLSQGPYSASGSLVKSQQVFSGVPTGNTRSDLAVSSSPAPAVAPGGAGMGSMMPHAAGANNGSAQRRDSDLVIALNPIGGPPVGGQRT